MWFVFLNLHASSLIHVWCFSLGKSPLGKNLQQFGKMFANSKNVRKFEKDSWILKKFSNSKKLKTVHEFEKRPRTQKMKKSSRTRKMLANLKSVHEFEKKSWVWKMFAKLKKCPRTRKMFAKAKNCCEFEKMFTNIKCIHNFENIFTSLKDVHKF